MAQLNQPISVIVRTEPAPHSPSDLYLDLMKRVLTRALMARSRERHTLVGGGSLRRAGVSLVRNILEPRGLELVRLTPSAPIDYEESSHAGLSRAEGAETMIGMRQLDNMQACIVDVIGKGVPGDLLEAGVWRGGMTIFMRAVLRAYREQNRQVWVADSFEGLPVPDTSSEFYGWQAGEMAVSIDSVRDNFDRYGLLDGQVEFLKGFFSESLPVAKIDRLAILRIDADLYQSTMDVLDHLYPKLSPGGYAIFDDYSNLTDCRRAIDEYRAKHGVEEEIRLIDSRAVYWQKRL